MGTPKTRVRRVKPTLRHVATVRCGPGVGLAVSPDLGLLVTSDYTACTLSVFRLTPG